MCSAHREKLGNPVRRHPPHRSPLQPATGSCENQLLWISKHRLVLLDEGSIPGVPCLIHGGHGKASDVSVHIRQFVVTHHPSLCGMVGNRPILEPTSPCFADRMASLSKLIRARSLRDQQPGTRALYHSLRSARAPRNLLFHERIWACLISISYSLHSRS